MLWELPGEPRFPLNPSFEGAIDEQPEVAPRVTASIRVAVIPSAPISVASLTQLKHYLQKFEIKLQCVSVGQVGREASFALSDANRSRGYNCYPKGGSYTWSNLWLLIDSALEKIDFVINSVNSL